MTTTIEPETGEQLRDEALDILERYRAAYIRLGCRAMVAELLRSPEPISTDFARAAIGPIHRDIDWKFLGAIPRTLCGAGVMTPAGFTVTKIPESHARPIKLWGLADRVFAEAWLRDNPEKETPAEPTLFE